MLGLRGLSAATNVTAASLNQPFVPSSVQKHGHTIYYAASQPHASWWRDSYSIWEPSTFDTFASLVPGKVVLDIGAWIGPTVLWEGNVAERVVALEPAPSAFAELQANLRANTALANRVVLVNAALDKVDRTAHISNRGDSTDQISLLSPTRAVSIDTLRREHPELEHVGFVKIDTEGYERVIVPSLEAFLREKRPMVYVSLHPMFISHEEVQGVVNSLQQMCPYLYEGDMQTPFNTRRASYTHGPHGGADVLCSWTPLA